MFRFKQFVVVDDRCAMKVGTDGVLLGAWAHLPELDRVGEGCVIDVGTGSGLVALMLAQRYPTWQVEGIELDAVAVAQARENVAASPFAGRIDIIGDDFVVWAERLSVPRYHAVVSNPPFFSEDLLPPDSSRASARHTAAGLTFERLVRACARIILDEGLFAVIIPKSEQQRFHNICSVAGFSLLRATDVRTVERKAPKRVLLQFVKSPDAPAAVVRDQIVLMRDGQRTAEYSDLCRDFYL